MMAQLLQQNFPDITSLDTAQAYDTPEGRAAAREAVRSGLRSGAGQEDIATAVKGLATVLEESIEALVAQVLPQDRAVYALEDASQQRLPSKAAMAMLKSSDTTPSFRFRVVSTTLESSMQAVLDCLTADRVTEELDAPTYVERLRGTFNRTRDGAATMRSSYQMLKTRAERCLARLTIMGELARDLQADMAQPETRRTDAAEALKSRGDALVHFAQQAQDFAGQFLSFTINAGTSLEQIEQQICSDPNVAGAEGESVLVSREAERHALFRPAPILWAFCVTLLAKIVLAHTTSEALHAQAVTILILTYVLTWIFSILLGIWARKRRMKHLQQHFRQQFKQALHDTGGKGELIEFPSIGQSDGPPENRPFTAFAYRGKVRGHQLRVMAQNLFALVLPAILLAMVLMTRSGTDQRFMARFHGDGPCVLAEGRLVFATQASFFVMPKNRPSGVWDAALSRVFPELLADIIPRKHVIRVKNVPRSTPVAEAATGRPDVGPRECTDRNPDRNAYVLTHVGEDLRRWVAPITIDVDTSLPTDATISVELGDASLEAIAQAISASAARPAETIVVSPVSVEPPDAMQASANIFQTSLTLDNSPHDLGPLGASLVLPVFSDPVRNGRGDLNTLQGAFDWGRDPDKLRDPVVQDDGTTYFNRIARTIESCLVGDATITIDVMGLASRSWVGKPNGVTNADLNHHLAEGRRLAALRKIVNGVSTKDALDRILVEGTHGEIGLASILRHLDSTTRAGDILNTIGRFATAAAFENRRDALLAGATGSGTKASPLEELLARSVILRVVRAEGGRCAS